MKKLSVLLLATVFVFGLVVQANAQVADSVDAEDQLIDFDDTVGCTAVGNYYRDNYVVSFSDNLLGETALASMIFPSMQPVGNFSSCPFDQSEGQPVIVTLDPPVTHVGFIGLSPGGGITVTPFRDGVAGGPVYVVTPYGSPTPISVEDSSGIDMVQIEGDGCYGKCFIFWIDDFTFGGTPDPGPTETEVIVKVNIKPPNCLDARIPVNGKSKGVTPVVIIGDPETYDVTDINPDTVLLQGVKPERWAIEDASHCGAVDGDGELDLTLKFDTEKLVDGIKDSLDEGDTLEDGKPVFLNLTGNLFDDTPIRDDGGLYVTIIMKGKHKHENRGRGHPHPWHDRGHHKGWDKNR